MKNRRVVTDEMVVRLKERIKHHCWTGFGYAWTDLGLALDEALNPPERRKTERRQGLQGAPDGARKEDGQFHRRMDDGCLRYHCRSRVREPEVGWVRTGTIHMRSSDPYGRTHRRASDRGASAGTGPTNAQAVKDAGRANAPPNVSEGMVVAGIKQWARSDRPFLVGEQFVNIFRAMYAKMLEERQA